MTPDPMSKGRKDSGFESNMDSDPRGEKVERSKGVKKVQNLS